MQKKKQEPLLYFVLSSSNDGLKRSSLRVSQYISDPVGAQHETAQEREEKKKWIKVAFP